ncbi:NADP-dependent malic enzyme [Altererythrobacter epoxidivorans]|uniref:NADP-dependent malic enzyme n=1 Tax=Altererythrobacter epoxidivorans TaxID=361183 RepID=A0A0M3TB11_9SPHN|nr:NADP-dependent malic enzyme [Altererythrobacter epoxidivorans]
MIKQRLAGGESKGGLLFRQVSNLPLGNVAGPTACLLQAIGESTLPRISNRFAAG